MSQVNKETNSVPVCRFFVHFDSLTHSEKSVWKSMLNGGVAGIAGRIASAPIDLLKIRFQMRERNSLKRQSIIINTLLSGDLWPPYTSQKDWWDFGRVIWLVSICMQRTVLCNLEFLKSF